MTPETVRAFQARPSYDWEGKRLVADGIPGPKTRWALAISELDERRRGIVANACHFVGLVETGTNRGREIDTWLDRCDAPLGSAWCAAFASWCVSVPGMKPVKLAGAQALGNWFLPTRDPVPGDVMWFRTGSWTGHCGIVVGADLEHVATVEGNQNNGVRLVRRLKSQVFFGRTLPEYSASAPMPPGLPLIQVSLEGTR
jgi:hypothetical protein